MGSRLLTSLLVAVAATTAACGGTERAHTTSGDAPTTTAGRPVTDEQALQLARTLEQNRALGGSRFVARFAIDGHPVRALGRVDFRKGRGFVTVAAVDPQLSAPRRFYWTRRMVLEQTKPYGSDYAQRAPDPDGDPVHAMIGFVHLLAADTIDNTANIRDQGARYLRTDALDGGRYDVFRYGRSGAITLWVSPDGRLRRATTTRVRDGLTVTLLTHAPVRIQLPRG